MKKDFLEKLVGTSLLLVIFCGVLPAQVSDFKTHTKYLSSDELKGRGTGSKEIRIAAKYIAKQFKFIGLKPIIGKSYFQTFTIKSTQTKESNVVGILHADQPTQKSLVFTAHYDAYGVKKIKDNQDTIHNGARDNAIGVAALIELARMFKAGKALKQNLVFVATAAEETGLHGSKFYIDNPVFPLKEITICLNIDGFNVSGPRDDFFMMPRQGVDFVNEIATVAAKAGWYYVPPDWVDGMDKSFDTASFLSRGVPAVTIWTGNKLKGGGIVASPRMGRIHTPSDEINENWNWDGVEDHLKLYKSIADYFLENPGNIKVTYPKRFETNSK